MIKMRTKGEIFARLNKITSFFSFARVLGYIGLKEARPAVEQLENSMEHTSKRLMTTEWQMLIGLWLHNVDINKNWTIDEDDKHVDEIYDILDELHQCYKPTSDTPLNEQLKEIAFYEGDAGYDYQYVQFACDKYNNIDYRTFLKDNFNFDIDYLKGTMSKLKNTLQQHIKKRLILFQKVCLI